MQNLYEKDLAERYIAAHQSPTQRVFGYTPAELIGTSTEILRKLGCHGGQGYYFDRPLPADQLEARYLKDSSKAAELSNLISR